MARSNRPFWLFLLVASPALADQRQGATTGSTGDAAARSADQQPMLADEHGTLVLARQPVMADEQGAKVLADEHGTLLLVKQKVLADEHGTLVLDMATASRPTEPE